MTIPVFVDRYGFVAGLPNSESPQHDCADECDNRDHHQDIELYG
jgi:hypothetical protein